MGRPAAMISNHICRLGCTSYALRFLHYIAPYVACVRMFPASPRAPQSPKSNVDVLRRRVRSALSLGGCNRFARNRIPSLTTTAVHVIKAAAHDCSLDALTSCPLRPTAGRWRARGEDEPGLGAVRAWQRDTLTRVAKICDCLQAISTSLTVQPGAAHRLGSAVITQ